MNIIFTDEFDCDPCLAYLLQIIGHNVLFPEAALFRAMSPEATFLEGSGASQSFHRILQCEGSEVLLLEGAFAL